MNTELCQLCEGDTMTGHAAPFGEGWMCASCLSAYGNRAPYEMLDALGEMLSEAAQSVAAQSGASAEAQTLRLAHQMLKSPALAARLHSL